MAFGYPGDATPDTLSEQGAGAFAFDDPERGGTPMVPLKDAALKKEDAENIYHVEPGETFTAPNGNTYRYADIIPDWSPSKPGYVDVYDPDHPPDVSLRSGHEPKSETDTGYLHGAEDAEARASLASSPETDEEAPPPPPQETPIQTIKKQAQEHYPNTDFSTWKDADYMPTLQKAFPDVPADKLAVYANQPGGADLIRKYETRGMSPLEKFRKLYADIATGDDEKDIDYLYNKFGKGMSKDAFRDKVKPPPLPVTWLKNAMAETVWAMNAGGPLTGVEPAKPGQQPNAAGQGLMAGLQDSYAWFDQLPKGVVDQMQALYGATGTKKFMDDVSGWLSKNVPAYGGANDWFRKYLGYVQARSDEFSKQAAQARAKISSDPISQIAGTIGEAAGGSPVAGVTLGGGVIGQLLEGTTAYGAAIEHHQKNALLQGISATGFTGLMQYTFNTAKGRWVSGIATALLNVSQGEIQKFLSGQPNDITKEGKAFVVGLVSGLLAGGKSPEAPPASDIEPISPNEPAQPLRLGYSPLLEGPEPETAPEQPTPELEKPTVDPELRGSEWMAALEARENAPPPAGTMQQPPNLERRFTMRWSFDNHPAPVREELEKAEEAHRNGDNDRAAQHIDKAFVFMPDGQKREIAARFIGKTDELAGESPKPFEDYFYSGIPIRDKNRDSRGYLLTHGQRDFINQLGILAQNDLITNDEYNRAENEVRQGKISDLARIGKSIQFTKPEYELHVDEHEDETSYTITKNGNYLFGSSNKSVATKYFDKLKSREGELIAKGSAIKERFLNTVSKLEEEQRDWIHRTESKLAASVPSETKLPYAIQKLQQVNPGAAERWKAMEPEDQQRYIRSLQYDPEYVEPGTTPESREQFEKRLKDTFNDYYFAGIPAPAQAIRDWFSEKLEEAGKGVKRIGEYIRPDIGTEARETAAQIIRQQNVKSKQAMTVVPADISRKHGAVEAFRQMQNLMYGDRAEFQRRYLNTRSPSQQLQDLIDFKNGTPIKDKLTNYIFQNIHRPWMESLLEREHRYGIETPEMYNYIQQNWIDRDELPKLQEALRQRGINPSFIKPQQMDLATGIALGFKLKTSNLIDIDQMRMLMHEFAIRKILVLRELENQGYAWESTRKDIPEQYRNHKFEFPVANGKSYVINPDLIPLFNNAFDRNSVYDMGNPLANAYFKALGKLKGFVAWSVSFSGFHPLHITSITSADITNNALWLMRHGVGTWKDATDAAVGLIPGVGDIYHTAGAATRYRGPVSYLQGRTRFSDLTADEQRAVLDYQDMGLDVAVNEERSTQFMNFFQRNLPQWEKADSTGMIRMGARAIGLLSNGFNRWWFHEVTPNLKFASAMMRRDTLAKTRPELFRAENRPELLREYGKIQRDIEGRYGEMNYENVFQPRWLKQLGTTHLLSYGWQLGMLRVMGDGVIDTTSNLAHWDRLVEEARARGATGVADKLFNERLAYLAIYGTKMLLTGAAISVLVGGKKPDQLTVWDGVYPVVGKDPNGKEKRVNMQYFFKEIPSYTHYASMANDDIFGVSPGALLHIASGKLAPMNTAIMQAMFNKDYMGHAVGTLPQRIEYLLKQGMEPISFENMAVAGATPTDRIMSILGFAPSGRWTMRSDMENKVLSQYAAAQAGPMAEARDEYRQAFVTKDADALRAAREKLIGMGVTEKQIKRIESTANVSSSMKVFNKLPHAKQLEDLRDPTLTPEERREWLKHASPEVRQHAGVQ